MAARVSAARTGVPEATLVALVRASWASIEPLATIMADTGMSARALERDVTALIKAGYLHWRGDTLIVSPKPIPRDRHDHACRYIRSNPDHVAAWGAIEQKKRLKRRQNYVVKVQPARDTIGNMHAKNGVRDTTFGVRDTSQVGSDTTVIQHELCSQDEQKWRQGYQKGARVVEGGIPDAIHYLNDPLLDNAVVIGSSLRSLPITRLRVPATPKSDSGSSRVAVDTLASINHPDIEPLAAVPSATETDGHADMTRTIQSPMHPTAAAGGSPEPQVKGARRGGGSARPRPAPTAPQAEAPKPKAGPTAWRGLADPEFDRIAKRWHRAHQARNEKSSGREGAWKAWQKLKPDRRAEALAAVEAWCAAYELAGGPRKTLSDWLRTRDWAPPAPMVAAEPEKRTSDAPAQSGGPLVMTSEEIWKAGCRFLLKTGKNTLLPGSPSLLDFKDWPSKDRAAFTITMRDVLAEQPDLSTDKLRSCCPDGYALVTGKTVKLLRDDDHKRVIRHFEARNAVNGALAATETRMAAPPPRRFGTFSAAELEAYCRDVGLTSVASAPYFR